MYSVSEMKFLFLQSCIIVMSSLWIVGDIFGEMLGNWSCLEGH